MWLHLCALCPIISILTPTTARSAHLPNLTTWRNPSSLLDTQYSPVGAQMPEELFYTGYGSSVSVAWFGYRILCWILPLAHAHKHHAVFSRLWQLWHWELRECTKRNSLQLHSPAMGSPGVRLIYSVTLHWRKLIFPLTVGINCS